MAFKQFALDSQTTVTVYKRKGSRSLKLSVSTDGGIRVTIPSWAPYSSGVNYAKSRLSWIAARTKPEVILQSDQAIGKAHHLRFIADSKIPRPYARMKGQDIVVTYPAELSMSHPGVQLVARRAGIRALRSQAENLLPQRLALLAERHEFNYRSVVIKQLKGRWGSCDSHTNIVLNLYLMQLPWECIDYVLLHELTHTLILQHGSPFWASMGKLLPNLSALRKQMRTYQPTLS